MTTSELPQIRMHAPPGFQNTLLHKFDTDTIARLELVPVDLKLRSVIEKPGVAIERLYFVEEGMVSMTTMLKDGFQVEVGMFGYESVIGVSALMGSIKSLNHIYTQIEGRAYFCSLENASAEFKRGGLFQELTLRYVQAQLLQLAQSAACNAIHGATQRLARWLLICSDRAHSDTFIMSQEFMSHMLGMHRPTVSIAAEALKAAHLIRYKYSKMQIVDRAGLEHSACECYRVIRNHLDNYAEFDGGVA